MSRITDQLASMTPHSILGQTVHRSKDVEPSHGYFLENNDWGAAGRKHEQSVYLHPDGVRCGFSWGYEDFLPDGGVLGFPEVIYGWKPWSQFNPEALLPKAAGEIGSLNVALDVDYEATGDLALVIDSWLTESSIPSAKTVVAEVMWRLTSHAGLKPIGSCIVASADVGDGRRFDLYRAMPGQLFTNVNWPVYTFDLLESHVIGRIDLAPYMKYLRDAGHISGENFVASVEMGMEVLRGSGAAVVNKFTVEVG